MPITGSAAAPGTASSAKVSGLVIDQQKRALVEPNCIYFWPKAPAEPDGWAAGDECIPLNDDGSFSTVMPLGDYKIMVEATNVQTGMFVGGLNLNKATTFAVTAKGLSGLVLKVDVLNSMSGKLLSVGGQPLANPNCAYFWYADKTALSGWSRPDECVALNDDGTFKAWLAPGTYRVEVLADNVALNQFAGLDGSFAKATNVKMAKKVITGLFLKVPIQPVFSGRFINVDGTQLTGPDSFQLWTPDVSAPEGWSFSGDTWDLDSQGRFYAYLKPGSYRVKVSYGSPLVSPFYGGSAVSSALTITMPASPLTQVVMRLGQGAAPTGMTGQVTPIDSALQVSWRSSNPAGSVAYYTATATPGGASCTTTSTSCVITGLKNGTNYAVEVSAVNESGITTTNLGTTVPAVPKPKVTTDLQQVLVGKSVAVQVVNVPANAKLTIAAKPGGSAQNVTASSNGIASASLTPTVGGIVTITVSGGAKAQTAIYVLAASVPTTAKAGKAVTVSAIGLLPNTTAVFTFGNSSTTAATNAKGIATTKLLFAKGGTFSGSVTVSGVVIASPRIVVS
jgi:hypothetical protein